MSKAKFGVGDTVKCGTDEGTVEEHSPTSDGDGHQYRVRVDMSDSWVPEEDLKLVKRAPKPGAPKVASEGDPE